jgi:hypothetical protein
MKTPPMSYFLKQAAKIQSYIRFAGAQDVQNTEAFLVTVVTRLCLDRLKS